MKKHYFFKIILFAIPLSAFVLLSFSTGRPDAFSGSPGDGGSNCTACHSGTASTSNIIITTNIPVTGYAFNTTYNVTITNSAGNVRNGFQVTAERNDTNAKVGSFSSISADTQPVNNNQRITHTSNGNNQNSWSFQWTSPATDVGRVTFYGASVSGNGANGNQGDQVFLGNSNSTPSLSAEDFTKLEFSSFPNPAKDKLTLKLSTSTENANVSVFDYSGRLVLSSSISDVDNSIDVSTLSTGMYLIKIAADDKVGVQKFIKI